MVLNFIRRRGRERQSGVAHPVEGAKEQCRTEGVAEIESAANARGSNFTVAFRAEEWSGALSSERDALERLLSDVKAEIGDTEDVLTSDQVMEELTAVAAMLSREGVEGTTEATTISQTWRSAGTSIRSTTSCRRFP